MVIKITTKYVPGESVWVLLDNKVQEKVIEEIRISIYEVDGTKKKDCIEKYISYALYNHPAFIDEDKLFLTKQGLIRSL